MSQQVEGSDRTFLTDTAIGQFLRVKVGAGSKHVALAGAGERSIGVAQGVSLAADAALAVRLRNAEGTFKMVASGVITRGAKVYGAASGKVSATVAGPVEGIALQAAGANNDIIEVALIDEAINENTGAFALSGATMNITAAMCRGGIVTTSHTTTATVNLPAGFDGAKVTIVKIDANAALHTIDGDASETINGATTLGGMDAQYDTYTLVWSGAEWKKVAQIIA